MTREMKVYSGRGTSKETRYPLITMQGKWLQDMGFSIGDKILVSGEVGRLVIERGNRICPDLKGMAVEEMVEHRKEAV